MHAVGRGGCSYRVLMPPDVVRKAAREAGVSVDEFLDTHVAVADYDGIPGVLYTFRRESDADKGEGERDIAELPGMPPVEEMEITFPLNLEPTARPWSEDLWRKRGWFGARVVAVAPGSVHSHKRWPIEHFIALCQELAGHYQVSIVVIGTFLDKSLGERLVESVTGEVVNLAGETTLSQSGALLERCTLLVGNDGGAMHLGSAMGCPVVSIVPGIEYPGSIEPFFNRHFAVRHPVGCAPCYSFTHCPMKHNECMAELPVSDVFERCARVLGREIVSKAIS